MTNLKKIGLTALAGTLATLTAQAGEMSVSGTAQMSYVTKDVVTSSAASQASDAFDQNTTIVFSGSGELDNGMTASLKTAYTGTGVSSSLVTLDMGDMGTLYMDEGNAGRQGITTIQDKVPNAGEQVWDDTGSTDANHGGVAQGVANTGGGNVLGYAITSGAFTLSTGLAYSNGTESSFALTASGLVDGLTVGIGQGNNQNTDNVTDDDVETAFVTYAIGGITLGAQKTVVDAETVNQDLHRDSMGVSFAVNENLSVSYGVSTTEFNEYALSADEENSGVSASYTSGGMTVGLVHNQKDNEAGVSGTNREVTELKLTLAF
jgi:outer membrane protein OmpU